MLKEGSVVNETAGKSLCPSVFWPMQSRDVETYSSIGGRRTGGLERSLAMFLFFVIPAVSFLFACTFAFTITWLILRVHVLCSVF